MEEQYEWNFAEIRQMFAERGQHAGELPSTVIYSKQEEDAQVYADSAEPEEVTPLILRIRERFKKTNPYAVIGGASVCVLALMYTHAISGGFGGTCLSGLGLWAMGLEIPWKVF